MSASSLGSLVIELAANTARLQSDMGKAIGIAERGAAQIKNAFKFAGGGLLGAAFASTVKQAIEFGDNINKAAIKAGLGGRAMSELAYAAKLADVDITALSTGMKKMQVALSEAASGAKLPLEALGALGLKIGDIKKLSADRQFEVIGEQLSKLEQPADRARAATELFGRAGADLLPLFEQGAEGIRKAREEAEKLGLAFDDKQLQKLSQADDAIKRLSASWEGFAAVLVSKVAPNLTWTLNRLSGMPVDINEQIADLEGQLKSPRATRGMGAETERNRIQQEIARLRQASVEQSKREMGLAGSVPTGPRVSGFEAVAAAAGGGKAAADAIKEQQRRTDEYRDMVLDLNRSIDASSQKQLEADMQRWQDREDASAEWLKKYVEDQKAATSIFDKQAAESAGRFQSVFIDALDAIAHGGRVRWGEFLAVIAAETLANSEKLKGSFAGVFAGIAGAIGSLFSNQKDEVLFDNPDSPEEAARFKRLNRAANRKGLAHTLAPTMLDFMFGMIGANMKPDGKANGGPVAAGQSYLVGERGMEIFQPSSSGRIIPNNEIGVGRASPINVTYHINNPQDAQSLPRILRENNRQLMAMLEREHLLR
jgi:hypothetical protein